QSAAPTPLRTPSEEEPLWSRHRPRARIVSAERYRKQNAESCEARSCEHSQVPPRSPTPGRSPCYTRARGRRLQAITAFSPPAPTRRKPAAADTPAHSTTPATHAATASSISSRTSSSVRPDL